MILAIDLETTGIPTTKRFREYYPPTETEFYDNSRIVSIAIVTDDRSNNSNGKEFYSIIKPTDFEIHNEKFHGISNLTAQEKGIPLQDFFTSELVELIQSSELIIGHNIDFDFNILQSELYRQKLFHLFDIFKIKKTECSMVLGKEYLKTDRYPRLSDLYLKLFDSKFLNPHHALSDANASLKCYNKIKNN